MIDYRPLCLILPLIAGCQTAKPVSMVVDATPTVASVKHGDVLAAQRASGQDIPEVRGFDYVTVRAVAVLRDEETGRSKNEELEGIPCTVSSEGYTAEVKTAAQVKVPNYGYASRPIEVRCKAPGYKDGIKTVSAYDITSSNRLNSAASGGLLGVMVVGLIDAADSKDDHKFGYPEVRVNMYPQASSQSASKS